MSKKMDAVINKVETRIKKLEEELEIEKSKIENSYYDRIQQLQLVLDDIKKIDKNITGEDEETMGGEDEVPF